MAKGVKKIKWTGEGKSFGIPFSIPNKKLMISPDQFVWFQVAEWEAGTTIEDKKKNVTWMWQENNRKVIISQKTVVSNGKYGIKLPKKLCGPYTYYIEASLSGKRDFKNFTGLYVGGFCPPKITKCGWSRSLGKTDLTNTNDNNHGLCYGETIYLHVETEGLNGAVLTIEVYNEMWNGDYKMRTLYNAQVLDGDINIKIQNTSQWQASIKQIQDNEEFYVKIKDSKGKYLTDGGKKTEFGKYLNIKNKLKSNVPKKPENQTATKVYEPNAKAARYEPCKFDAIKITETEKKDGKMAQNQITIFEEGKTKLEGVKNIQNTIKKEVFFQFDKAEIEANSKQDLENILNFLLEHPFSTMKLDGYACVIGKQNHNNGLSQRRSDSVRNFFTKGGLDARRIISKGHGEVNATDDKKGRDNIKYKNEYSYIQNRRVDISFDYFGHDAQTIVYETIAPSISTKKDITVDIIDFSDKACFRIKDKHKKEVKVIDIGQAIDKGDTKQTFPSTHFIYKIYSDLSKFNIFPIQYIWPIATTPNKIYFHLHSCRWFSNPNNATFLVKVYPDIKWTLKFFLNLTNDLSVKWQNVTPEQDKKWKSKSGKVGAERRWLQKDASFGFSLKSEWDKNNVGNYTRNKELKAEYESKFKKLYDLFSSIGNMSDGITSKTKGKVRGIGLKGIPVTFAVKPPNLNISGEWNLERAKKNNTEISKIGTKVDISFNAEPLIGLDITIDLLGVAVGAVAGAVSMGAASEPAILLYQQIKDKMNTGVSVGNDKIGFKSSADVYIDLVISNTITTKVGFSFNTVSDKSDNEFKLEGTNKLKIELKAGVWGKAELAMVVVKVEGYFEASAKGYASVTFGHGVYYKNQDGLYYQPKLGFDGLIAEYVVKGKVGMSFTKSVSRGKNKKPAEAKGSSEDEGIIAEDKIQIVPPFDVIKELEKLFGFEIKIKLT